MKATTIIESHDNEIASTEPRFLLLQSFAGFRQSADLGLAKRIENWQLDIKSKQAELDRVKRELQELKARKPRKSDKSIEAYNERLIRELDYAKSEGLVAKIYPYGIDTSKLSQKDMVNLPDAKVIVFDKEGN